MKPIRRDADRPAPHNSYDCRFQHAMPILRKPERVALRTCGIVRKPAMSVKSLLRVVDAAGYNPP
jgi:hypothetical protein